MTKTYQRWREVRGAHPRTSDEDRAAVACELLEMDLRELRESLGKTQEDMAGVVRMSQSEVSRLERREDHRLSTLRRVVHGLGGELELIATFGDRRVRLRAAG